MKHHLAKLWRALNLPKNFQLRIMRLLNDEFLVGVTGVILNQKNEVLLLKHTYRQTQWSLPGGYLKTGEHPKEGLEREVKEETGFMVKTEKIIRTWHDRFKPRLDISCYGQFIKGEFIPSSEAFEYGFFAYEDLPDISTQQKKLIKKVLSEEKNYFASPHTIIRKLFARMRN